ncbi:glycerol-3-phosphate 1-O-acyltransferase PlsB [Rudaea cellulosilytica]|uniref:glycerol-3-phosphate 1-O-acyltransferase PlsB n=1 Tax=Rudaea cellulosilytica TaxID=540746 RepID=UPI00036619B8|nr:glycerol-3-phosphate 1-O-acyltransferase PlsB [Rudaea cellulosilytica]
MNDQSGSFPPVTARPQAPWWLRALGALAEPWLKIHRDPADPRASLDPAVPVCYVIERYGLSDTLILEQACREAGLPEPLRPFDIAGLSKQRAMFALSRRDGWWFQKPRSKTHSQTLAQLLEAVRAHPDIDVQLVPVAIFVGRAPDRESGWFRVLFSENWNVVGRFRRLLALLLNGRSTIAHFAAPVSLRAVIAGERDAPNTLRKVSRVLRVHFQRQRAVVIGPDLSHRRTLIDAVINAAPVQAAIATAASKENVDKDAATAKARAMAWEIAADQSHPVVRSASSLLTGLWDKIYSGVRMHHFDKLRAIAPGHEVIYVPCHRSHIDYLLLSYLLYRNGIAPPHIAGGVNLNLPLLGSFLRRGGAFFMRRSFSDPLYSTVFREYMSQLFARGVSIEYFVEGGRSRTGRTLTPRGGLLSMTLRSFLRESQRPVVFQPVYIGYERIMEGDSYIGELSGKPKEKESWFQLLRALGKLRENYGQVAVNFGEPIFLAPLLDSVDADWRAATADPDAKPAWLKPAVDALAERIAVDINRAVDVNPINLIALVLLATPKHAMAEADLLAQIDLTRDLITALPYSERLTITSLSAAEIIAYGEKMAAITRITHPLGDVLASEGKAAVLLSYFRNNVLHVVATAAWIACCFLNNRGMKREQILRLGRVVYPFVQAELFLPWSEDAFASRLDETIDFFVTRGLLKADESRETLQREPGQSDGSFQLRVIAQSLLQTIERYYIAIAALVRNGPNTLTATELENLCTLTAQRLSLLQQLNAPEFFDKALFRGFIAKLRERRVIWPGADGKLEFHADLESIVRDAKLILSREIRHGILKLTPERRNALSSPNEEEKTSN